MVFQPLALPSHRLGWRLQRAYIAQPWSRGVMRYAYKLLYTRPRLQCTSIIHRPFPVDEVTPTLWSAVDSLYSLYVQYKAQSLHQTFPYRNRGQRNTQISAFSVCQTLTLDHIAINVLNHAPWKIYITPYRARFSLSRIHCTILQEEAPDVHAHNYNNYFQRILRMRQCEDNHVHCVLFSIIIIIVPCILINQIVA